MSLTLIVILSKNKLVEEFKVFCRKHRIAKKVTGIDKNGQEVTKKYILYITVY